MKISLLITLTTLLLFIFAQPTLASYLYLSPDSSSLNKDSTISFDVKLNTQNEVINGISAYLAFPQDKLEAKSVEVNKTLLPIVAEEMIDGNVIKLSGGNFSSMNGTDLKIGTVVFRTKTAGNALVNFIPGSAAPRTLDSTDSLDLASSKGAILQIQDNGDGDSNNPTPQPSSSGKVTRCQDKEASFKSSFNNINSSLTDFRTKMDTIYALVDDYYTNILTPEGKTTSSYADQRQQVDSQRSAALDKLNTYKNDIAGFSCKINNPKDRLNQLKTESQSAKNALNDYKSGLQGLIKVLRNIK